MRIRTTRVNSRHEPTEADQMRLRLAQARLRELREMDLGRAQPADLILTADRLGSVLEDMISLVTEAWHGKPLP